MKTPYVYILPFEDGRHFKIGRSSESEIRIRKLHWYYMFDLEKCIRIKCKKGIVGNLENTLLKMTRNYTVSDTFDKSGRTEIRLIDCHQIVITYLIENQYEYSYFSKILINRIRKARKKRTILPKPEPQKHYSI
jgi:hypothetical protein